MKKSLLVMTIILSAFLLVACSGYYEPYPEWFDNDTNSESYQEIIENPFVSPKDHPTSNISLSVNTAAYTNLISTISSRGDINPNQVRIEEMINYFNYQYDQPVGDDVFRVGSQMMVSPWNNQTYLLSVGIQAKEVIEEEDFLGNNIVFLIDVSGSMASPNKLSLAKDSLIKLVDQIGPNDKLSIVTFSNTVRVVFSGKTIDNKSEIKSYINNLRADGGTSGHAAIQKAYQIAEDNLIVGGQNRVILVTDGDFNIGISNVDELKAYVSEYRETGIYFSLFGFGRGNLRDDMLEALAIAGNGVYHYIDSNLSAQKAFIEDYAAMMYIVARDTKAQITFDEDTVLSYRLIGYENKQLSDEEFDDEYTNAGEIGSSHQVTAIYEVKLKEPLQSNDTASIAGVEVRYKDPDISKNEQLSVDYNVIVDESLLDAPTEDLLFISAIVEFGLYLRDSQYKGTASPINALSRIDELESVLSDVYKKTLIDLLEDYIAYYE